MTTYTILVKIPKAGNKTISFDLDIGFQEDYPEDYFRQEENKLLIKQKIESQTLRTVTPSLFTQLLESVIKEVKLGRRQITVSLDLPSIAPNSSTAPTSFSASENPLLSISTPTQPSTKPKVHKPPLAQTAPRNVDISDPWVDNNQQPTISKSNSEPTIMLKPKESGSQTSKVSVASTSSPKPDKSVLEPIQTEEPATSYETANNEYEF